MVESSAKDANTKVFPKGWIMMMMMMMMMMMILFCYNNEKKGDIIIIIVIIIITIGGVSVGETLEQSAVRETYEEAGISGVLGPLVHQYIHTNKAKSHEVCMCVCVCFSS